MLNLKIIKKAIKRIIRILFLKKGIYGDIGKGNKFSHHVFISEFTKIGSYNYVGPYTMMNNCEMGNFCSVGPGVKIGQAEHSKEYFTTSQMLSKPLINYSLNKEKSIIGNDVWLAANVVILQGIEIGDGAIVGANAVVTKDIPPYAIAVGMPAKVINYRFSKDMIKQIQKTNWFKFDFKEALFILKKLEEDRNDA